MNIHLNRRDFVKLSLTTLSGFSLSPLIKGCTPNQTVPEVRKTRAKKLESHPAIPTPTGQGANTYLVWGLHLASKTSGFIKKRKYFQIWPSIDVENQLFKKRNIEVIKKIGKKAHYITN
jgi:hypothetical protein